MFKGLFCLMALCASCFVLAAEPVTLRVAITDGGDGYAVVRRIADKFEAAHPSIKVKLEPIVDNFSQKLMTEYAAGISPDVACLHPSDYRQFAARKALLPLDPFLSQDKSVDLKAYYPNILDVFRYEKSLWVLPRDIAPSSLIYYNKNLFLKAGIPFPDGTWTYDIKPRPELKEKDFLRVVEHLSHYDPDYKKRQYGYATAWPQLWFTTILTSTGLRFWDSDKHPTKVLANDPKVVELFTFAADIINKKKWMPTHTEVIGNSSSFQDEFCKGKIAMIQSGAWEIKKFRPALAKAGIDWDITTFPSFRGQVATGPGEGTGTAIFASTKHPKEAWEFVKWMSGKPGMTELAQAGQCQPAIRSLANTAGVWLPKPDATGKLPKPESIGLTDKAALAVRIPLVPEYFNPIKNSLDGSVYDVLTGVKTPAASLELAQKTAEKLLPNAFKKLDSPPYPIVPAIVVGVLLILAGITWVYWPERGRKLSRVEAQENRSAYLFLIPWFVGLALFFGPMIYSLLLSFGESDIITPPKWRGLDNYTDAFILDDTTWISIRQTFIYCFLSIPLGTAMALALALLLNTKVKGIPLFRALFYLPSLASGVAMSLIWMQVFNVDRGILNQIIYGPDGKRNWFGIAGMLSNWAGTPGQPINWINNPTTVIPAFILMGLWGAGGGTIIFLAGLQGISTTYYEAATLDGATAWKRFIKITLPLLTPTLFFSLITGVMGSLMVFSQAFVMTGGGPDRATMFYMVNLFNQAFQQLRMGYASALAWILFLIIMVFTLAQLAVAKKWVYYEGDVKG